MVNQCSKCWNYFRVLEDERNDHPCPKCGYHPEQDYEIEEEDE